MCESLPLFEHFVILGKDFIQYFFFLWQIQYITDHKMQNTKRNLICGQVWQMVLGDFDRNWLKKKAHKDFGGFCDNGQWAHLWYRMAHRRGIGLAAGHKKNLNTSIYFPIWCAAALFQMLERRGGGEKKVNKIKLGRELPFLHMTKRWISFYDFRF